jgi:hypothetical protein
LAFGMNTMLSGPMSRALTHLLMSARCLLMASILTWHDKGGAAAARRMAKHFRLTYGPGR